MTKAKQQTLPYEAAGSTLETQWESGRMHTRGGTQYTKGEDSASIVLTCRVVGTGGERIPLQKKNKKRQGYQEWEEANQFNSFSFLWYFKFYSSSTTLIVKLFQIKSYVLHTKYKTKVKVDRAFFFLSRRQSQTILLLFISLYYFFIQ